MSMRVMDPVNEVDPSGQAPSQAECLVAAFVGTVLGLAGVDAGTIGSVSLKIPSARVIARSCY